MHFSGATLGEVSSPEREESGCGAGIFSLTSTGLEQPPSSSSSTSKPAAAASASSASSSNFVRLLVGSKHHFDLVKINLGPCVQSSDSTRILTLASGSSTGAISATEVSICTAVTSRDHWRALLLQQRIWNFSFFLDISSWGNNSSKVFLSRTKIWF